MLRNVKNHTSLSGVSAVVHADGEMNTCCDESSDRSLMVDLMSYFSFQPVLNDWFNQGRFMCYPVCGMVHTEEPLLLTSVGFLSR